MPKFLKFGKKDVAPIEDEDHKYSISIKDGVFEYARPHLAMTKAEFKRFWKYMPKKKELKGKEFEDVDTVAHLVIPEAVYKSRLIEGALIKRSGLATAEANVKKKFPWFGITEAHVSELVIDKVGEGYVASLKIQGVCVD